MKPALRKAGALALSLGMLGALVTHAAITGCKPSPESASATAVKDPAGAAGSASALSPAASTGSSASSLAAGSPSATGSAAATAASTASVAKPSGQLPAIEEPEWLPASKAGPVFRPKGTPKPQSTSPKP